MTLENLIVFMDNHNMCHASIITQIDLGITSNCQYFAVHQLHKYLFKKLLCSLTPQTIIDTIKLIGLSGRRICRQLLVMIWDKRFILKMY